jgi:hypothetical protein
MEHQIMAQSIRNLQQQHDAMMTMIVGIQRQLKNMKPAGSMGAVEGTETAEVVPYQMRTTLTSAKRVSESRQLSQVEKTARNIGKTDTPREEYRNAQEIAYRMDELKNIYFMRERSLSLANLKSEQYFERIPESEARAGDMEEHAENIKAMQGRIAELEAERHELPFWKIKRKKEIGAELELLKENVCVAKHSFNSKYHIPYSEASFEIKRIRKQIDLKRSEYEKQNVRAAEAKKELDAIELEYCALKQTADNHPNRELIYDLLEQMREAPTSARKSLHQIQLERHLDKIADGKIR